MTSHYTKRILSCSWLMDACTTGHQWVKRGHQWDKWNSPINDTPSHISVIEVSKTEICNDTNDIIMHYSSTGGCRQGNGLIIDWSWTFTLIKTLAHGGRIIPVQHNQYHGCWWPGSLRRQDISTHDIDYILSYMRKDFNYLCHVSVEEWYKL